MRRARGIAILGLRAYQLTFSALIGRQCRYLPTCSDYASEAIARYGVWRGGLMGAARVCRCHPWGGSGYDPVPHPSGGHEPRFACGQVTESTIPTAHERASSCADSP